ncbi:MAG TPA: 50S ribosomal protein L25 [Candidatus Limnocylindria bacterium]|nr:50S ribosomal protein L25 [Candidatus Limnocylindria bacterium]
MDLQIAVDARTASGKQTRRLRAAGIVPGVLFGKKAGSVPVQLDAKAFEALYREAGRTSIIKMSVDGRTASVVIKSVQRNPLTGRVLHVDFFAPDLTHEMQADVPLVFSGEAPAVEATGGTLFTSLDHLKVKALPADMPHEVQVDVSPLVDLDTAIHVSDLAVPDNVTVLNEPEELVAKVMPPRVEEEPEVVAEEELEGEVAEGGEGAEGAERGEGEGAPAEGGESGQGEG